MISAKSAAAVRGGRREPRHFVPLKNEPGELIRIDKNELRIDPAYQRKINERSVGRIAANWSWLAAGVLIISLRSDGKGYFIVDGQHRWEAAKLRDDVTDLPCLAFELDSVQDEAIGFLGANTERKIPTLSQQFNALLLAKDPIARVVDELAREAGRAVGAPSGKTHVSCVAELMRAVRYNETALRRVWPLLTELSQDRDMPSRLVKGLFSLERRMPSGYSLTDPRWANRLKSIGPEALIQSMKAVAAIEGNASERTCAAGIVRAINKGLKNPMHVDLDRVRGS